MIVFFNIVVNVDQNGMLIIGYEWRKTLWSNIASWKISSLEV